MLRLPPPSNYRQRYVERVSTARSPIPETPNREEYPRPAHAGVFVSAEPESLERLVPVQATTQEVSARTVAAPFPKVRSLAPERFALQVTISKSTHDKLRHAQEPLSHALPSGDLAQVLDRALDALIGQLEKSKFGATDKPRPQPKSSRSRRHVPAHVKRAVWERLPDLRGAGSSFCPAGLGITTKDARTVVSTACHPSVDGVPDGEQRPETPQLAPTHIPNPRRTRSSSPKRLGGDVTLGPSPI
jgi:hypothetical protein